MLICLQAPRPLQTQRCCNFSAGPVPHGSHQHQNSTPGPRPEPAQGKRGAGVVSSTAQEAKEDLLAGDLELLSGHLEKAKRCHIHVTSTDSSPPAPAMQPKPVATQQAKPAPESPTMMQQQAAPARAPQRRQPDASSQRHAFPLSFTVGTCVRASSHCCLDGWRA